MTQLTNSQTELLKYVNSELSETKKQMYNSIKLLAHWLKYKNEPNPGLEMVIDYEIDKLKSNYEVLEFRCKWLETEFAQLDASLYSNK